MDTYVIIFMGIATIFALGSLAYIVLNLIAEKQNGRNSD